MSKHKPASRKNFFESFATKVTKATGSTPVFISAFIIVLVWGISGPFFNYSETWQLVINTGTTIITFLMVFLIQKAQNKDSLAIQLKLNELVASHEKASNRLVDVEDLTEAEMETLEKYYRELTLLSKREDSLRRTHSIDEAEAKHREKVKHSSVKMNPEKPKKPRPKRRKPKPKTDDSASSPTA